MSRRRDRGFAFVEAIVAAAVVAAAAGLMFQILADGAARSRATDVKRMALLVAESRLAAMGSEIPLVPGASAGVESDFIWGTRISPYRVTPGDSEAGELVLVVVTVRPRNAAADAVVLRSLRLAPPG